MAEIDVKRVNTHLKLSEEEGVIAGFQSLALYEK